MNLLARALVPTISVLFLSSATLAMPAVVAPKSVAILPLSDVAPGMVGEARTVFQGVRPESFKVRVVSIMRKFLPKQDIILIRAEDPRLVALGVAAGMSGSPVYIDGKLMGAIAYGWSFAKEPLAGVTPIESMLAEGNRSPRPPTDSYHAQGLIEDSRETELRPVAIPLAVAGASDASIEYLREQLEAYGLRPVRAGGGASKPGLAADKSLLVPGAAVGVALIQGDMSTTAMGTLTHVVDNRVFAFGHSMFGIGAVNLPMVLGEVHAIIPSLSSSLKMSSPIGSIGAVTDDTRNGIIGIMGQEGGTVPVTVRVRVHGKDQAPFSVSVARHRRLLPLLTTMAVTNGLADAVPHVTDIRADITTRLAVRGFDPLVLRDQLASTDTLAARAMAMSHGMRVLADVVGNPFEPVVLDSISVDAAVEFVPASAEIAAIALEGPDVRAGARASIRVTLRPYAGQERTETLSIDIPRTLAGRTVKIEVASGSKVQPEVPRPENLRGFIDNLRVFYPASSLVVSVVTRDDGASLHGRILRNLPPSAMDTLRPANQTRVADTFRVAVRSEYRRDKVFSGRQELTVQVREP